MQRSLIQESILVAKRLYAILKYVRKTTDCELQNLLSKGEFAISEEILTPATTVPHSLKEQ